MAKRSVALGRARAMVPRMSTDRLAPDRPRGTVRHTMSKVPEVTVWFWVIKVLTTGMGETA